MEEARVPPGEVGGHFEGRGQTDAGRGDLDRIGRTPTCRAGSRPPCYRRDSTETEAEADCSVWRESAHMQRKSDMS